MVAESPTLLVFDFPARPPGGPDQVATMRALAEDIATEPGLLWKIWTASAAEQRAGGAYLFASRAAAEAYHRKHAERLGRLGITGIEASYREIVEPLSRITRAPIP
jgi:hypothetical protein